MDQRARLYLAQDHKRDYGEISGKRRGDHDGFSRATGCAVAISLAAPASRSSHLALGVGSPLRTRIIPIIRCPHPVPTPSNPPPPGIGDGEERRFGREGLHVPIGGIEEFCHVEAVEAAYGWWRRLCRSEGEGTRNIRCRSVRRRRTRRHEHVVGLSSEWEETGCRERRRKGLWQMHPGLSEVGRDPGCSRKRLESRLNTARLRLSLRLRL
jgi:hypothetical protein